MSQPALRPLGDEKPRDSEENSGPTNLTSQSLANFKLTFSGSWVVQLDVQLGKVVSVL